MKQRITQSQMDELTDAERLKLADWADPIDDLDWPWSSGGVIRKGKLPLLTIGQMIWFLDDHIDSGWLNVERAGGKEGWRVQHKSIEFDSEDVSELVDALWEAVKAVLKEEVNDGANEA